jgi:hypothetical protein
MTTLFDINDEIELTMRGTVHSFSISNSGDCYVIYLKSDKEDIPVYLNSDSLVLSNAKKVGEKE